jgi:hypothetical protein
MDQWRRNGRPQWRRGDSIWISLEPVELYVVVDSHQFDEERDRTRIKVKRGSGCAFT